MLLPIFWAVLSVWYLPSYWLYNFGIYGALIAAVTYQSIVFLLTLLLVLNTKWFKPREIIQQVQ